MRLINTGIPILPCNSSRALQRAAATLAILLAVAPQAESAPDSVQVEQMAQRAGETVRRAFRFLWEVRERFDLADTLRDPERTGVIGVQFSPLTTTTGYENSKELSTKPGWAGWLVRELKRRGIWERADVAVSMSGSFPALNIAVLAALQELGADVKCISSVGASSYGANEPGLSWPEMERLLREKGILRVGSSAVSMGGSGDRGGEWGEYEMNLAMKAVKRSNLPLVKGKNLRDSIGKRMLFYGDPKGYFCYINVGGNHASMGGGALPRYHHGGWFFEPLEVRGDPDGVMDLFLRAGVPCLNLLYLDDLNNEQGIVK